MSFKERLQYLRMEMNLSEKELADEIGITETAIRLYEKGKLDVSLDVLEKLANYFNVSTKLLLGTVFSTLSAKDALESYRIVQDMVESRNQAKTNHLTGSFQPTSALAGVQVQHSASLSTVYAGQVPVFDSIKRNQAISDEHIIDYRPVNESITRIFGDDLANYFFLHIHGDIMEPTLKDTDTVLVKKQSEANNNDIVVALTGLEDAVLARLIHTEKQKILFFDNKNYPAEAYNEGQCRIVGKVIWRPRN